MSASRHVGSLRAVGLLCRVGLLRWRNRLAVGMQLKRRARRAATARADSKAVPIQQDAAPAGASASSGASGGANSGASASSGAQAGANPLALRKRAATGRKRPLGVIGLVALGLFMLFASALQATSAVRKVQAEGQDILFLPKDTYKLVRRFAPVLGPASEAAPLVRRDSSEQLRAMLDRRLSHEMAALSEAERAQHVDWIVERIEQRGIAAFALDVPVPFVGEVEVPWSRGPDDPELPLRINRMGWLFALCGVVGLLSSLGGSVQDLGKVDWSLEWLSSFPTSQRALFWGRFAERMLVSPMHWFVTLPAAWAVFVMRGWSWASLPLALFVALWIAALVSALSLALETSLRLRFANLKNVQAVLTVAGSLLFVSLLWLSNAPELPTWFEVLSRVIPAEFSLFGHAGRMLESPAAALTVAPLLALEAAVIAWLAIAWCAHLTRHGLLIAPGGNQGERGHAVASARRAGTMDGPRWLRGALRKDLLLLARDRAFLAQTLFVPLLVVAIQFALNHQLLQMLVANANHAAAFAFGLGAYMLVFSAAAVLSVEGNSLWILLTAPQPLDRVLRKKALLWALLGTLYTLGAIGVALWLGRWPDTRGWVAYATALAGIPIYAFIAAALGALATDPLEQEVRRRIAPATLYMYMLLVALYVSAIYTDLLYVKLVQLVLSTLLAYALWQRVRDRIPYLLDPTDAPPPQLGLSDGLLAALGFLACQSVFFFWLGFAEQALGMHMLLSFVLAGALTTLASLYLLQRAGIPDLLRTLGLARSIPGARAVWRNVLLGCGVGAAASLLALVYMRVLARYPELLKSILPDESLARMFADEQRVSFVLLAIVGAPLVEEYLFRGLVFRGMQRSLGTAWAVLGSAAVFALVHPAISALPVFVLGVAAALVFQRGGRLWGPIACHMTYNAIVLGVQIAAQDASVVTRTVP
jgi:membrane protease YdiL (CAAX protease family)